MHKLLALGRGFVCCALVASVWLSIAPLPLAASTGNLSETLSIGKRQESYGDFPLLVLAIPEPDGHFMGVYKIEGNSAHRLTVLDGYDAKSASAQVYVSPNLASSAILLQNDSGSALITVDLQTGQVTPVARGEGRLASTVKGSAFESLTSVVWSSDNSLFYTKVTLPSSDDWASDLQSGKPHRIDGQLWMSSVDGKEQRLLVTAPIYRVLATVAGEQSA